MAANVPNIRVEKADVPNAAKDNPYIDQDVLDKRVIIRDVEGTHYDVVAVLAQSRVLARHPATQALSLVQTKGSTTKPEIDVQLLELEEDTESSNGTLKATGKRREGIAWQDSLENIQAINLPS